MGESRKCGSCRSLAGPRRGSSFPPISTSNVVIDRGDLSPDQFSSASSAFSPLLELLAIPILPALGFGRTNRWQELIVSRDRRAERFRNPPRPPQLLGETDPREVLRSLLHRLPPPLTELLRKSNEEI